MIRLALILTVLAQPAAALSCMRPDIARTYAELDAAPESYALARGTLTLDPEQVVRPTLNEHAPEPYTLSATFQGHLPTAVGFNKPLTVPVTVEVGCAGPWCGAPPDGASILFLEQRGDAVVLKAGACPFYAFAADAGTEAKALACLRGEGCRPEG